MKRCAACGETKPVASFHVRRASPDGLAYKCKPCVNAASASWREKNPSAHLEWYARNREHKSEYFRRYREVNRESIAAKNYAWSMRARDRVNEKVARRMAQKLRATVAWADREAMARFYALARAKTAETGVRHEVDHIVPLQGRIVTGLHCEANLRVVTKAENISKLNRFWPDMPC